MLRSYKPILVGRRGRSVVSLADPPTGAGLSQNGNVKRAFRSRSTCSPEEAHAI